MRSRGDTASAPPTCATANGAAGANFQACAAILEPGDDVLMERPGYDPLPGAAQLLGANIVRFDRRFESGFALDPDEIARALTARTKLIVITSPHNPTGALADRKALADVGRAGLAGRRARARRRGLPGRRRRRASACRAPRRSFHLDQQPDEVVRPVEPAVRMVALLPCRGRAHPPGARRYRWFRVDCHGTSGHTRLCPARSPRGAER